MIIDSVHIVSVIIAWSHITKTEGGDHACMLEHTLEHYTRRATYGKRFEHQSGRKEQPVGHHRYPSGEAHLHIVGGARLDELFSCEFAPGRVPPAFQPRHDRYHRIIKM